MRPSTASRSAAPCRRGRSRSTAHAQSAAPALRRCAPRVRLAPESATTIAQPAACDEPRQRAAVARRASRPACQGERPRRIGLHGVEVRGLVVRHAVSIAGRAASTATSVRQSNDCSVVRSAMPAARIARDRRAARTSPGRRSSSPDVGVILVSRLKRTGLPLSPQSANSSASVGKRSPSRGQLLRELLRRRPSPGRGGRCRRPSARRASACGSADRARQARGRSGRGPAPG